MRFRGIIGLLSVFSMAHFALVGSDLVCAKHSVAQGSQSSDAMPGMDHGPGQQSPVGKLPCKIPARADCCQAVASCAPSVAVASVVAIADALILSSTVPSSIDDVPLSRIAAPEPPPPKA